jgi:hypothetical protein
MTEAPEPGESGPSEDAAPPAGYGGPSAPQFFGLASGYGPPGGYGPGPDPYPAPILVSFAEPQKQNRLTVGFRGILAIPHFVILFFVSVAAWAVTFIGWFAALFAGRLPRWAHEFLTGYLRWATRVFAYLALLTDAYPPFMLEDADYPVRLVTNRAELNRMAVLFRIVLLIPVGFVASAVSFGLQVMSFFAWLITLFAGRMPASLHQAFAAITRFYARYTGYAIMLTPEYPSGLFGDNAPLASELLQADAGLAGEPARADPWRLALGQSGKTLVIVALVLGVAGDAGNVALRIALEHRVTRAASLSAVNSAYDQLSSTLNQFPAQTEACGQEISCVTALDRKVEVAFSNFGVDLANAGVPSQYTAEVRSLSVDGLKVIADFSQLSGAKSAAQYRSAFARMTLQADLAQWQSDLDGLEHGLSTG